MKRLLVLILSLLIAIVPIAGCNEQGGGGTGSKPTLELNRNSMSMGLFGEGEITATATNISEITWENSNPSAVAMIENGNTVNVIAIQKSASSVITASGGGLTASCVVAISGTDQALSLSTEYDSVEIRVDGELTVPATVKFNGSNFTKATLKYWTEDSDIATVDAMGVVKGKSAGTTLLSVQAEYYGHLSNVALMPVTVKAGPILMVSAANLELYAIKNQSESFPNAKALDVSIYSDGTEQTVQYTALSDNEDVVTCENGVIKAVGEGNAIVTVICNHDGAEYSATVNVKVNPKPSVEMRLSDSVILLYAPMEDAPGSTHQLTVNGTIGGLAIDGKDVTWTVDSGSEFVSVDANGLVVSVAEGNAVVSANYAFGEEIFKASCNVNVIPDYDVYFGQDALWAHDGIIAEMTAGQTLVYKNATLPTITDGSTVAENLIRFQLIPEQTGLGASALPIGPQFIYITIQDAEDLSNYITILVAQYHGDNADATHSGFGVQTAEMAKHASLGNVFYGQDQANRNSFINKLTAEGGYGLCTNSFSMVGHHLKSSDYQNVMAGIVSDGAKVWLQSAGKKLLMWDLSDFNGITGWDGSYSWNGFSSDKVNIFIKFDSFVNGATTAKLSIDTLGGETLNKTHASKFKITDIGVGEYIPTAYQAK